MSDSIANLEERSWLAKHLRGDKQAFAKLIQAYRKPVYSYLLRSGFDRSSCDDLFQDIFFKIHKSAKTYQPSRPLSPWIFTIAVNTVRNHKRDQLPTALCIDEVEELLDSSPSPENSAQSKETLLWLEKAMLALPDREAQALHLASVQGLKIKDIAQILGQPINTIKTNIRRARISLIKSFNSNDKSLLQRSIS